MKFIVKFEIGDIVTSKSLDISYQVIDIDNSYYSVKGIENGIISSCHFTFLENGFEVNKKLIRKLKLNQIDNKL